MSHHPLAAPSVRVELTALLTALWFDIDHNQGASASAFFTPEAQLRFEEASFRGRAAIEEVYRRRAARGPRLSRHVVTNLHLQEAGENQARGVSTLLLFAEDGHAPSSKTSPLLVADVWDEFERYENTWLIGSRWIRNLFIPEEQELAVPVK